MSSNQWVCQKCGKVGGFFLMGDGFIMCEGCGAWHVVTASGKVIRQGEATPWLAAFKRGEAKANAQ